MSESMNLAPAVVAIVGGHVPKELYGLAVLSAAGVLVALVLDWVKESGR
jgi:hypothetical protein